MVGYKMKHDGWAPQGLMAFSASPSQLNFELRTISGATNLTKGNS